MKIWAVLAALLLAPAQDGDVRTPEAPIDIAALKRHIVYLADDALEGRAPGTEGGNKAAFYVASELAHAGLSAGGPDGSWYQPVNLIERHAGTFRQSWRARGSPVSVDDQMAQFVARDGTASLNRAKVVFGGYGIDLPSAGFDDLKGVDVRDKVVLILSGRPEGAEAAPGLENRREAIAKRGAVAVVALVAENDPWPLIRERLGAGRTVAADRKEAAVEGALGYPAWQKLIAASGLNPTQLMQSANKAGFKARALAMTLDLRASAKVRRYASYNVIGRIAGSDPGNEAVLLMAHWDHLGLCRPEGVADQICNGAVDNASGVALIIEIARRLAHGPRSRRTIYVVGTTAEEMGLVGAKALVAQPPVPLDYIVAALNLDTVALAPAGAPIAVIGRGRTSLDPLIDEAAHIQKRRIVEDEAANAFINRQDGWVFLNAGIPAVMVGGAFSDAAKLATFLAGDYHKPTDDLLREILLDGAAEDGALHVVLAQILADPRRFPREARSAR